MNSIVATMLFVSVLIPQKGWYAPDQPIAVNVKADGEVTMFLTDFGGKALDADPKLAREVSGEKAVDVKALFPGVATPGTYVLYAVPKGKPNKEFAGTPLVIEVRQDRRQGAPPGVMAVSVAPLCYAVMTTEKGPMTLAFYYDVAPNTVANFLRLAQGGFYDGLGFHRIVKEFVIQGGDPRGDGTGGPGYMVQAEFNERPHEAGVLSMARSGDPNEVGGAMPRHEFANSAGSQFFVCLNYDNAKQLDRRYTAFGKVVDGMNAVNAIAAVPLAGESERPVTPPKITRLEVRPVTSADNPYPRLMQQVRPSTINP